MHPFTGLALLLPTALLALRLHDLSGLLALLALPLALLLSRPQGLQRWRQWGVVLLPLALGLLLVHGHWLDSWQGRSVENRDAALLLAARLWLRVAIVLAGALLWLSTTTPERLVRALLASPLPPAAAYLLASPMLLAEQLKARLAAIAQAQAARGVDLQASWFRRWRSLLPLAMPLIVWTLSDVGERAAALDARAFRHGPRRTTLDAPLAARWEQLVRVVALFGAIVIAASDGLDSF
jgi:energy-coupling factor transport system permease protein